MPEILLSVDMQHARDHIGSGLVPPFGSLWIIGILGGLPLPRLGILYKGAFLPMELAEDTYRGLFLDNASTLSLPLQVPTTAVSNCPKLIRFGCDLRKHRRVDPSASADSVKPCLCIVDAYYGVTVMTRVRLEDVLWYD